MSVTANVSHNEDGTAIVLSMKKGGAKAMKFPTEDISAGNFWTKLTFNSWAPHTVAEPVNGQSFEISQHHLSDIWLPMPLTLGTGYNQNFTDTEDVMVNRGLSASGQDSFTSTVADGVTGVVAGVTQEINKGASAILAMNATAKMAKGSIANNNMGLVYDGATLRSHTFSWRMTPKNEKEQTAIRQIVQALKAYTSPVTKGALGGNPSAAADGVMEEVIEKLANNVQQHANVGGEEKGVLRSIGRLAIPPTVSVTFWYGDKLNPHLFKVKDSFILNLEVNYTPTGTWNAYLDGAPVETQITMTTKETSIVTAEEVVGGY